EQLVEVAEVHDYDTKVMFSSVRHAAHVRQALLAGVHLCPLPFHVLQRPCDNTLMDVGVAQFRQHTQLMPLSDKDLIREENPVCRATDTLTTAMVGMTESRLGAVTVVDDSGAVIGVFTDGDLRRRLQKDGRAILDQTLGEIGFTKNPITIGKEAVLNEAVKLFKEFQVDSIIVVDGERPAGILDIQDLVRLGLLGPQR